MATELTKPIELSPSQVSGDLQENLTTTGNVFESEYEKKSEELGRPLTLEELDQIGKKSVETATSNKLDIISDTVGEPVTNSDFKFNKKDLGLNYDLSRSKSFVNRRDKFLSYYPEGEFINMTKTIRGINL